jgi:hypothetical protein
MFFGLDDDVLKMPGSGLAIHADKSAKIMNSSCLRCMILGRTENSVEKPMYVDNG